MTTYDGDVEAQRALEAGASGYLLKSSPRTDLLAAIRAVHAGRRHIPPAIAVEIAEHRGDHELTDRELDVLQRVAAGRSNKIAADELGISEETVKTHMKSIFGEADRKRSDTRGDNSQEARDPATLRSPGEDRLSALPDTRPRRRQR